MDIQFAYNVERLIFYLGNQNPNLTKNYMERLYGREKVFLDELLLKRIQKVFMSTCVGDGETLNTIRKYWEEHRYALCPHSAIGVYASELEAVHDLPGAKICVLTAHPVKFEETLRKAGVLDPVVVPSVERLKQLPNDLFTPLRRQETLAGTLQAWVDTLRRDITLANPSVGAGSEAIFSEHSGEFAQRLGGLDTSEDRERLEAIIASLIAQEHPEIFDSTLKLSWDKLAMTAATEFNKTVLRSMRTSTPVTRREGEEVTFVSHSTVKEFLKKANGVACGDEVK